MDHSTWHSLRSASGGVKGNPCLFKLGYEQLNSSCSFCFLIRSEDELAELCLELEMYPVLQDAFEVKKGGFLENMDTQLGMSEWKVDDEDDGMVLL